MSTWFILGHLHNKTTFTHGCPWYMILRIYVVHLNRKIKLNDSNSFRKGPVAIPNGLPVRDTIPQHDDVIKWKHFPRNWSFVRGIHRSPVNSPHKGQWRGALMFSLICVWINGWANNREAGDLRHYRTHYDVIVMSNRHPMKPWGLVVHVYVCLCMCATKSSEIWIVMQQYL